MGKATGYLKLKRRIIAERLRSNLEKIGLEANGTLTADIPNKKSTKKYKKESEKLVIEKYSKGSDTIKLVCDNPKTTGIIIESENISAMIDIHESIRHLVSKKRIFEYN